MNFAELALFLAEHCDSVGQKYNVKDKSITFNQIPIDNVSVFNSSKAVVFSGPVGSLELTGIIHTEKCKLADGSIRLDITCKDELTGDEYNEKIILSADS